MSVRGIRWMLFGALVIALPFPILAPFDVLVPPLRYAILFGAATAVALVEGAGGAMPLMLGMLALSLALSLASAWVVAWGTSRTLAVLGSPQLRSRLAIGAVCIGLVLAASLPVYKTGFGRTPTASLLGILP